MGHCPRGCACRRDPAVRDAYAALAYALDHAAVTVDGTRPIHDLHAESLSHAATAARALADLHDPDGDTDTAAEPDPGAVPEAAQVEAARDYVRDITGDRGHVFDTRVVIARDTTLADLARAFTRRPG